MAEYFGKQEMFGAGYLLRIFGLVRIVMGLDYLITLFQIYARV